MNENLEKAIEIENKYNVDEVYSNKELSDGAEVYINADDWSVVVNMEVVLTQVSADKETGQKENVEVEFLPQNYTITNIDNKIINPPKYSKEEVEKIFQQFWNEWIKVFDFKEEWEQYWRETDWFEKE